MELVIQTRYNNAQFYKIIKTSEPLSIISYQEMISCDFTNDNQYILCAYISQDKSFTISVHNKYLELIQVEKKYAKILIRVISLKLSISKIILNL